MVVLVRVGNEAFGELKGKVGLVERLFCQLLETERETLSTRGTAISWAGVMVRYPKFQASMLKFRRRYEVCSGLPSLEQSGSFWRGMREDRRTQTGSLCLGDGSELQSLLELWSRN